MVSSSDRKRLCCPTASTALAKLEAAPVSVITPMMTPTWAQAIPTGSACRAPSAKAATRSGRVGRLFGRNAQASTRTAMSTSTGAIPQRKKAAQISPSTIQKRVRIAPLNAASDRLAPRISTTVSSRPTRPAKSGV